MGMGLNWKRNDKFRLLFSLTRKRNDKFSLSLLIFEKNMIKNGIKFVYLFIIANNNLKIYIV